MILYDKGWTVFRLGSNRLEIGIGKTLAWFIIPTIGLQPNRLMGMYQLTVVWFKRYVYIGVSWNFYPRTS